jgi:hypothetical protein
MSNKKITVLITYYLIWMFLGCWAIESLLFATIMITSEAIIGIIIYYMQKFKKNDSIQTKFILIATFFLGAILAREIIKNYSLLLGIVTELSLFIIVIYFTNKIKQIKSRVA